MNLKGTQGQRNAQITQLLLSPIYLWKVKSFAFSLQVIYAPKNKNSILASTTRFLHFREIQRLESGLHRFEHQMWNALKIWISIYLFTLWGEVLLMKMERAFFITQFPRENIHLSALPFFFIFTAIYERFLHAQILESFLFIFDCLCVRLRESFLKVAEKKW